MSEDYDLKRSENKVGQLYPILKSKDGQIIDGFHRQTANPNWKTLVVPEIDTEEKLLLARLIANFHRRQVERWEKEQWINGLARIYQLQGLSAEKVVLGKTVNQLVQKLVETTGLSDRTITEFLSSDFKQPPTNIPRPNVPSFEKVEKVLGKKGAEKYRKQVLEEAKLTPQERGALTKKRAQEKEERDRKREENRRIREEKEKKKIEEKAKTFKAQELMKDPKFQRDLIQELQKPRQPQIINTNSPAVCQNLPPIKPLPQADIKGEHLNQFWKEQPNCLCKKCEYIDTCMVIR